MKKMYFTSIIRFRRFNLYIGLYKRKLHLDIKHIVEATKIDVHIWKYNEQ